MLKHINMTNNNAVGSRVLQGVFLAVLLAVFGLTACSSGGGSTTTDTTTTPTTLTTYTITASTGAGGTVTPSGATTVAQGASQSYTITPSAGYAIATLVIDGTTVATSSTHTFTNVQANHTISATFIAAAPGGIVLSLVPARTSGVAPLAVFFDASGTTDIAITTRPFHDLEYTWSFGDPGSGTWASGAQPGVSSKNSATGPVAAHVFETPGTYTVSLTAFDGTSTAATTTTITVQNPDTVFAGTNTICINASGSDFTGCPSGADTSTNSNFVTALSANIAMHKRILFRRGDTFTAATSAAITVTGPGIVGAFGTGVAPVVQMTGAETPNNAPILNLSSANTPTIKDWRIMDLELDGLGKTNSVGIDTHGSIKQVLVLNMNMHDIKDGILFNGSMLEYLVANGYPAHTMYDEMAIVDSTISPVVGLGDGWRIFAAAIHFSIMGNELGDMVNAAGSGSHVVRIPYISKGVIANNTIARSSLNLAIKMHGPYWCDADSIVGTCDSPNNNAPMPLGYSYLTNTPPIGPYAATSGETEQVVVSDNKIIGAGSPYLVVTGPRDGVNDERVRDIIIERNWFQASNSLTQKAVVIHSYETTARNNICDMTGGAPWVACFEPSLYSSTSAAHPPYDIRIYSNTAYRGNSGSDFSVVKIDTTSTNVTVQNNLAYAPLSTSTMVVNGTGGGGLVQSNNSTPAQIKNTFPAWVSANPSSPENFSLTAGSYARKAGLAVPVWSDFFRTSRPLNGMIDMGAVEGH